jgi:ABC-type glycerol-3-phosphate transport system substrate-binding protein
MGMAVVSVLAACAAPAAPAPAQPEEAAAPVSAGAERRTLEMWMWETEPRWKQVEAASGVNEQFPDVEFKWTALPFDQLHQKALTSMAAGLPEGLPSIIRTYMGFYRAFVNTGALMDLTEQVSPYEEDVLPAVWRGAEVDGKLFQVPDDTGVTLFGYRWDLFEEAGLPTDPDEVGQLLATYDDLIQAGIALKDATDAQLFNMLPNGGLFTTLSKQDSTGNFDADGNVIFDSDYHAQVAQIAKDIWDAGITSNFEQGPQMWQAYTEGKLATMFYPNWQDFVIVDNAPDTAGKWRVTKLPRVQPGGKRAVSDDGVLLAIPSILPADQKELAVEVALYMKLTEKATVAHMKTFSGAFVSYIPGLEAMADEPSPILDNQFVYQIYLQAAQDEDVNPWYRTSVFFPDAGQALDDAMFKILRDGAPIADTLEEAADSIRQLQESRGTM